MTFLVKDQDSVAFTGGGIVGSVLVPLEQLLNATGELQNGTRILLNPILLLKRQ